MSDSPISNDIHAALMDSQFRAGAKAGWNAAQMPENEAAAKFAALIKVEAGDLVALRRPKITSQHSRIADAIEACDWSGSPIGNKEILRAAVSALRSAALSEQTEPVKVKALEWTHHDGNYPTWRTLAPHFEAVIDKGEPRMYGEFPLTINGRMSKEKYGTLEAAQAAAQADFERRVGSFMRSALVNAQADADVVERLKEALQRISDLTPARANSTNARDLHLTVKAIADAALRPSEVGSATTSSGTGGSE